MNQDKNLLVSIIIPTYNRAHLIGETLDSIIKQTYVNWECIIVDDYSTDETFLVASKIAKTDSRIKVFKRPVNSPKGPSACRNYGFEKSSGDFINWFDSDDIMLKNKLEVDLNNITLGDYDFTISQSQFFDNTSGKKLEFWNDSLFSDNPMNDFILIKIGWGINTPLWKKESLLNNNLLFDERLITADDYFYHIQALEYGLKPVVTHQVLVEQRVHSDRLENYRVKAVFKLIVIIYLLKNFKKLKLDPATVIFLKNQSIKQVSNLYKHKKIKAAIKNSLELFKLPIEQRDALKIIKLFLVGLFYNVTSRGYNYLN